MTDDQERAEVLDDEVIADDQPTNDDRFVELPAEEEYPPDVPRGVSDPGLFDIEDDITSRAEREQDEEESTEE
jgi:hypothetical protein